MKAINKSGTSFTWQINCYQGCEHGCRYCYARKRPFKVIGYEDWIHAAPRLDTPQLLQQQLKGMRRATRDNIKDIFICSACDAYQPLELKHQITRQVVEILITNNLPFTVLTKNKNVLRDINLLKGYDKCRAGFTIITLDDDFRRLLEPSASPIADRCEALRVLKSAGVSTYCSIEPMMPDSRSDPIAIVVELKDCVDLFEFGKWNPKLRSTVPVKYDEGWYVDTFQKLNEHCDKLGIEYCHAGHSKDFLEKNGFEFRPYPVVLGEPPSQVTVNDSQMTSYDKTKEVFLAEQAIAHVRGEAHAEV
jgi:hypothetical protein